MKRTFVICQMLTVALSAIQKEDVNKFHWGKAIGEECGRGDTDCVCAGPWVQCCCPHLATAQEKSCHCAVGSIDTCWAKQSCPNRAIWGGFAFTQWRRYYNGGELDWDNFGMTGQLDQDFDVGLQEIDGLSDEEIASSCF